MTLLPPISEGVMAFPALKIHSFVTQVERVTIFSMEEHSVCVGVCVRVCVCVGVRVRVCVCVCVCVC